MQVRKFARGWRDRGPLPRLIVFPFNRTEMGDVVRALKFGNLPETIFLSHTRDQPGLNRA